MLKNYTDMIKFSSFEERFKYLKLSGIVGKETFGFDRVFNQMFYASKEWKNVRNFVIARDNGCDLGVPGYDITYGKIFIHHMNPITIEDIAQSKDYILNPEYLITMTYATHNAIHYGDEDFLNRFKFERFKNDTCPWKK